MPQRIAYLTDLHLDDQYPKDAGADTFRNWEMALQDLTTRTVDKVIVGGDFGEPSTTSYFFESLAAYSDLHLTLGNHDQFANILSHYPRAQQYQEQGGLYYSFVEDGYQYIFLDSSSGQVPPAQVEWLQTALTEAYPILLFIHHPIFGIDDSLADVMFPLKGRVSLQQILLDSGLDISIFCGHYHLLDEQKQEKVQQFITPAISVQFDTQAKHIRFHANSFSYRIIEVNKTGIWSELIQFNT
ncbi:MAG: metallophosphoesterase family protein [Aureispira sp.]